MENTCSYLGGAMLHEGQKVEGRKEKGQNSSIKHC